MLKDGTSVPDQRIEIQRNVRASLTARIYYSEIHVDRASGLVADWLGRIQPGDSIAVYPKAMFVGWENYVYGVQVVVRYIPV